jgi:hypothetical protein
VVAVDAPDGGLELQRGHVLAGQRLDAPPDCDKAFTQRQLYMSSIRDSGRGLCRLEPLA